MGDLSNWKPGEAREVGRKLYAMCHYCGSIIRHKLLIGFAHLCVHEDERRAIDRARARRPLVDPRSSGGSFRKMDDPYRHRRPTPNPGARHRG